MSESIFLDDDDEDDGIRPSPFKGGSIFDDDMVEKFTDSNGRPRWKCKWCSNEYSGWNATKAIRHLNKIVGMDIKPCRVKHDVAHRDTYREFSRNLENKRVRRESTSDAMERSFSVHNDVTATTLDERRSISSSAGREKRMKPNSDPTSMLLNFSPPRTENSIVSEINSGTKDSKDSKTFYQLKIHDGPNPSCESKLTMAIADMIHSLGLR